jgi:predicted RNA-binding Zn-ribbon protein involved in translation (DUF1610 family)
MQPPSSAGRTTCSTCAAPSAARSLLARSQERRHHRVAGCSAELDPVSLQAQRFGVVSVFRCPNCGKLDASRSRTQGLERLVKYVTAFRPYRCRSCGWRRWCKVRDGRDLAPVGGLLVPAKPRSVPQTLPVPRAKTPCEACGAATVIPFAAVTAVGAVRLFCMSCAHQWSMPDRRALPRGVG